MSENKKNLVQKGTLPSHLYLKCEYPTRMKCFPSFRGITPLTITH